MKNGWQKKSLSQVSAINYGYTESAAAEPVGPRFLRITDIQDDSVDWQSVPYCPIATADLPKYRLASGDIVFARTGATTGKSFLVNDPPEAVFASYLIRLRLTDQRLLPEFVTLFFQTADYWQSIRDGSSGSAQGGFNATKLGALTIPVPPLAEQQRIVGILDEAFEGIATAKANAEKNLQNARALFESHLTEALSSVDKNWPSRPLDSLLIGARKISYGIVKPGIHDPDGVRLIKSQQVRDNSMDLTEDFRITKQLDQEYARTRLHGGEILLNLVGASIGRSAFAPAELQGANVSRAIAVIPVRPEFGRWVQYNLRCSVGQTMIQAKTGGSAQPVLNLSEVKSMEIPFPSIIEQQVIVQNLDALVTETHRLATIYERKLTALYDLKKSLLHQAFTGQLTMEN